MKKSIFSIYKIIGIWSFKLKNNNSDETNIQFIDFKCNKMIQSKIDILLYLIFV